MKIEVLGPGCPRCHATEENVKKVVSELGLEAEVVKISDLAEMTKRGVLMTPAVVVDGQIKSQGKIPSVEEIRKMLGQ